MRRSVLALLATALIGTAAGAAAPPLLVTFKNQSGQPAATVYVGFVGSDLTATNAATGQPILPSQYQSEHWYKLSSLRAGIKLSRFVGGRIYVGFGTPWHFTREGYEPSPSTSTDPAYHKRYDKMELTYTGDPADVADTTSIDYFSIPLKLAVYHGGPAGKLIGSVTVSTTAKIEAALSLATTQPGTAIVTDPKTKDFIRVIGPGTYPPPPGLPASPYDNFNSYLNYLRTTYAPAHGKILARIKGHFAGVGPSPTTPETKPQDYAFTATIDAADAITLTGSGTVIGKHTLQLTHAALIAPSGIYGANPAFALDGAAPINPANDLYGWMIGDLLAGLNVGAVGSTVMPTGRKTIVGEMNSQDWFKLPHFFAALQPTHPKNYNRWAPALAPLSQAYNFAYSDRFAHVVATLNPDAPSRVDTLEIVFAAPGTP